MDYAEMSTGPNKTKHDPCFTAVDEYVESHLLTRESNPIYDALEYAHQNSLARGCPDIAVTPLHGRFLALQAKIAGAKNILEVGTLGGYSTIWMASTSPEVNITTIEINPEWKELAEEHFKRASIHDRVRVVLGAAKDVLRNLREEVSSGSREPFDFVFIDADKQQSVLYFTTILDLVRPRTPIFFDNVVRQARLADEEAAKSDARVQGVRDLIEYAGKSDRVEATVIQTVSAKEYDGFMLALTK